jgi:hypothetical protein
VERKGSRLNKKLLPLLEIIVGTRTACTSCKAKIKCTHGVCLCQYDIHDHCSNVDSNDRLSHQNVLRSPKCAASQHHYRDHIQYEKRACSDSEQRI